MIDLGGTIGTATPAGDGAERLREASRQIERAFLSEMLKHAKVGEPREAFGGGVGEAQFASMLRDLYAEKLVDAGGLGLSEAIFKAIARTDVG